MNTQIVSRERSIFSNSNSPSRSNETRGIETGIDVEGKVKNRLFSMWNNVKYGMKLRTNFSKEHPVWLLGQCYRRLDSPGSDTTELGTDVAAIQSQIDVSQNEEGLDGFKKDFISRLWLTYRREFPILNGSNYSSDCGWGCMIRSGQMLIAQALIMHFLKRDWRWDPDQNHSRELVIHRKIIKWFGDKPSKNSPLSIHTLVNIGEASGKKPGDWYGPGFVAHLFKQAFKQALSENYEFDGLTVCVAQDCAVYIKDVMNECVGKKGEWKSLILLVPVRLGAEKFNSIYSSSLIDLFRMKQCIGVIGGRPRHSLYFVGYQEDRLIHLDPHYCQEVVDVWAPDFPLNSFHCRSPRKIHISKIDPSCCIGFYCRTREEFLELTNMMQSEDASKEYPMFIFSDGHSKDAQITPQKLPPISLEYSAEYNDTDEDMEIEAYEIL